MRLSVVLGVFMGVGGVDRGFSEEVREAGRGAAARRLGTVAAWEGARERSTGAGPNVLMFPLSTLARRSFERKKPQANDQEGHQGLCLRPC